MRKRGGEDSQPVIKNTLFRGVFRAQSDIYDGAFLAKIVNDWKPLTIFAKLYRSYSTGSKYAPAFC